jgi:hypothetical protein
MEHAYQAAHHQVEDGAEDCRPCRVDGDRASLRVVSGVASAGCILGAVGGRYSVLRHVRAVDVHGYICSGGDGSGSLLSRPRPSFLLLCTRVRGSRILRTSQARSSRKFAKGTSTSVSLFRLAESVLWGLYGGCVTMHNIRGALIRLKDLR